MSEKQFKEKLEQLAADLIPENTDLWPGIHDKMNIPAVNKPYGKARQPKRNLWLRITAVPLIIFLLIGLIFIVPEGRAWAQEAFRFFTHAESNKLPTQTWQYHPTYTPTATATPTFLPGTPTPTPLPPTLAPPTPTPDPANIYDVSLEFSEVQKLADYTIWIPTWLPNTQSFTGASYEEEYKITRLFYGAGLVFKQQRIPMSDDCDLCGMVGANAYIQLVEIGSYTGEFVTGGWNLTEDGPVWSSIPSAITMRWQNEDMAFELFYMGSIGGVTKSDFIKIAESLQEYVPED